MKKKVGRPKIKESQRKQYFSISVSPKIANLLKKQDNVSLFIERVLLEKISK